jgi:hypothetical protein
MSSKKTAKNSAKTGVVKSKKRKRGSDGSENKKATIYEIRSRYQWLEGFNLGTEASFHASKATAADALRLRYDKERADDPNADESYEFSCKNDADGNLTKVSFPGVGGGDGAVETLTVQPIKISGVVAPHMFALQAQQSYDDNVGFGQSARWLSPTLFHTASETERVPSPATADRAVLGVRECHLADAAARAQYFDLRTLCVHDVETEFRECTGEAEFGRREDIRACFLHHLDR